MALSFISSRLLQTWINVRAAKGVPKAALEGRGRAALTEPDLGSEPGFQPERCLRISQMKEQHDADNGTKQ
jgi:hypothetical protein